MESKLGDNVEISRHFFGDLNRTHWYFVQGSDSHPVRIATLDGCTHQLPMESTIAPLNSI
jgi:hypothetical protein